MEGREKEKGTAILNSVITLSIVVIFYTNKCVTKSKLF